MQNVQENSITLRVVTLDLEEVSQKSKQWLIRQDNVITRQ